MMPTSHPFDQPPAMSRQMYFHCATISTVTAPAHEAGSRAAIDECNRAVMTGLQPLSKLSDAGPVTIYTSPDVQQQQVLFGRNTSGPRRPFTETQELRQSKAKVGQRRELLPGNGSQGNDRDAITQIYHGVIESCGACQ